ncbi:hypothetical protein Sjap_000592 [Stephania japonica]|uniref:Uncharacterized protein n=1 Tax=Stephania japonica TaxID=461633 RepID=A0AAP0PQW2_9MAGN
MMSAERSFDAWEEVQRHGHDLADRLAQGFNGLLHTHVNPPSFSWPNPQTPKLFDVEFPSQRDFVLATDSGINGVSAIFDFGNRLGQAGAEFGAAFNGVVQQFFRRLPVPFRHEESEVASLRADLDGRKRVPVLDRQMDDFGVLAEKLRSYGFSDDTSSAASEEVNKGGFGLDSKSSRQFGRPQFQVINDSVWTAFYGKMNALDIKIYGGVIKLHGLQASFNFTSSYDSRTHDVESSLVARGELWRLEASHGSSVSGNGSSPMFLVQLGPLLFVRDSTLLLPVHLSKQHLLWYGYDRKNGMHSLCPAVWSKHRRWLLMSMICLNPLACSFMDLQFPNGQLTYVAGEGLTSSAFLPVLGGLLQVQGQLPGDMRFSYSCKNKWGTCITPSIQWPDKSFSLGLIQALAWKRSGLMVRPTVQMSICPTFGGSDPGFRAEVIHSMNEKLSLICGCSCTSHPSAFASVSLGRSKWSGNVGSTGIVVGVETPLGGIGRPSFSIQLNSGVEF